MSEHERPVLRRGTDRYEIPTRTFYELPERTRELLRIYGHEILGSAMTGTVVIEIASDRLPEILATMPEGTKALVSG